MTRVQKLRLAKPALIALAAMAVGCLAPSYGHAALVGYVPGRLLVKFLPGSPASEIARLHANAHARLVQEIPQIGVEIVDLRPGESVARAYGWYYHNPNVEFVELDGVAAPELVPNDPSYGSEWHLPKISAPSAWDTTVGDGSVIIAILDSGVDSTHVDLAPQIVPGWNFYSGDSDTRDVYGHGTAVAGFAGARGNNGAGGASVAWGCRLMPIRITDTAGYALYSTAATALTWAADHGARVANLSFAFSDAASVTEAARYFVARGGVVTMAAGNQNTALTSPDNPYVITVGATDQNDARASFSNTGPLIDVVAPGVSIFTTASGGGYWSPSGTSASAPLVAGIAALVLSVNPALTPQQVQDIIAASADDLGPAGWDSTFGHGRVNVARALEMARGTAADLQPPSLAFSSPVTGAVLSGPVQVQLTASDNVAVASVTLSVDGASPATDTLAPYVFSWDTSGVANGSHTLRATATDSSGNTATAQVAVTVSNTPTSVVDTTPPVVAIISPTSGSPVSASVTVRVDARDDVAVTRVELYLDDVLSGTSSVGQCRFKLSTRKWACGTHLIQALAFDAAGNSALSQQVLVVK